MPNQPNKPRGRRSPEAIAFARNQRATANEFAQDVWQMVRGRRCRNQKFRREYPIPPYTADFCCVELKLVIEVDGEHHFTEEGKRNDARRDRFLEELGYRVLRIPGYDVIREPGSVLEQIEKAIDDRKCEIQGDTPSPPAPLPQGGEGSQSSFGADTLPHRGEVSQNTFIAERLHEGTEGSQRMTLPRFEIIDDQMASVLRQKTDAQRLRSVDAFWKSARAIIKAAICTEHPEWDAKRINSEIARRISNGALDDTRT